MPHKNTAVNSNAFHDNINRHMREIIMNNHTSIRLSILLVAETSIKHSFLYHNNILLNTDHIVP